MPAEESNVTETVVVITGAAPLAARAVAAVPAGAVLIAADGGLDHALAAGLTPSVLIGDLDSIRPAWPGRPSTPRSSYHRQAGHRYRARRSPTPRTAGASSWWPARATA
jgi:thiamine pyrophosphokinase